MIFHKLRRVFIIFGIHSKHKFQMQRQITQKLGEINKIKGTEPTSNSDNSQALQILNHPLKLKEQRMIEIELGPTQYPIYLEICEVVKKSTAFFEYDPEQSEKFIVNSELELRQSFGRPSVASVLHDLYIGSISKGIPSGFGKLIVKQGVYIGQFKDGRIGGYGVRTITSHYTEEGNFENDELNGQGRIAFSRGQVWEGDFVDGYLDGDGRMTFLNGDSYEGEFMHGMMHGKGILKGTNGKQFDGEFREGYLLIDGDEREFVNKYGFFNDELKMRKYTQQMRKKVKVTSNQDNDSPGLTMNGESELKQSGKLSLSGILRIETLNNNSYAKCSMLNGSPMSRGTSPDWLRSRLKNTSKMEEKMELSPKKLTIKSASCASASVNLSNFDNLRAELNCINLDQTNEPQMLKIPTNPKMSHQDREALKQQEIIDRIIEVIRQAATYKNLQDQCKNQFIIQNVSNLKQNYGSLSRQLGDSYVGQVKQSQPMGFGIYKANDYEHIGQFFGYEQRGFGIKRFRNGNIQEGNFDKCKLNGEGKYTILNPQSEYGGRPYQIIEGVFKDGQLNGRGKKTYGNGGWEEGEYVGNELHGKGKKVTISLVYQKQLDVSIEERDLQEGEFREGVLNGEGKHELPNGIIESGTFQDGYLRGKGHKTIPHVETQEGFFHRGYLNGNGKITYVSGLVKEGKFKFGRLHGPGNIRKEDKIIEEGDFKEGVLQPKIVLDEGW